VAQLSFLPALDSVGSSAIIFALFHDIVLTSEICVFDGA
jgi:hypothetical protein